MTGSNTVIPQGVKRQFADFLQPSCPIASQIGMTNGETIPMDRWTSAVLSVPIVECWCTPASSR